MCTVIVPSSIQIKNVPTASLIDIVRSALIVTMTSVNENSKSMNRMFTISLNISILFKNGSSYGYTSTR